MLKYNGKGFIRGIPTRNLTDEEVKLYGRDRLLKSGLYEAEGGLLKVGVNYSLDAGGEDLFIPAEKKPRRKKTITPDERVEE